MIPGKCFSPRKSLLIIFLGFSMSVFAIDTSAVRTQVEMLNRQFSQALETGDVPAMLRYYATDAVAMPEHHPTLFSRSAIHHYFQQWLTTTRNNRYQRSIYAIMVANGYVLESGNFTHTFTFSDRQPSKYSGKYIHIWRIGRNKELAMVSEIWGAADNFDRATLPPLAADSNNRMRIDPVLPADSAAANTINNINRQIAQLVKSRNGAGFAKYYTADAIYMPYYMPMVIGRDSIHQYYLVHEGPNVHIDAVQISMSRLLPAGNYFLANGYYRVNWRAGEHEGLVTGKSINIWRKEPDGTLKLYWQMTNHD